MTYKKEVLLQPLLWYKVALVLSDMGIWLLMGCEMWQKNMYKGHLSLTMWSKNSKIVVYALFIYVWWVQL